jgi:hypothetical protein
MIVTITAASASNLSQRLTHYQDVTAQARKDSIEIHAAHHLHGPIDGSRNRHKSDSLHSLRIPAGHHCGGYLHFRSAGGCDSHQRDNQYPDNRR